MKTQIFFRGVRADFFFEKYIRTPDLSGFEKKPELINFDGLPPQLTTAEPIKQQYKDNNVFAIVEGKLKKSKDFHHGLKPSKINKFLFFSNTEDKKSELLFFFTEQYQVLWVAYFRGFRVYPNEREKFHDAFMSVVWRLITH
jgi:hypothetical protein